MNQKEKNRVMVHKTTAEMVRRDEANKKLIFAGYRFFHFHRSFHFGCVILGQEGSHSCFKIS